jgi:hypothetical protein
MMSISKTRAYRHFAELEALCQREPVRVTAGSTERTAFWIVSPEWFETQNTATAVPDAAARQELADILKGKI